LSHKAQSSEQSLQEQRNFPRVSESCHVSYRKVEGDPGFKKLTDQNAGIMNNISGGGLSFGSSEAVPAGAMLALEVTLPAMPANVIAMGRVAWCRPGGESAFDIGVEFWWIGWEAEQAQAQIRNFIATTLKQSR
jgi:Tfp pilus assembly protein PilZ